MKLKLRYIPLLILGGVVVLSISAIGILNVAKFAIYHDYYSREEKFCSIPGIHDNFTPQGLAHIDGTNTLIASGYMSNKTASRLYKVNNTSQSYKSLSLNGEDFKGHCGGVAYTNNYMYIANSDSDGSKVYKVNINEFENDNPYIELNDKVYGVLAGDASFVFASNDKIYVGEFAQKDDIGVYSLSYDGYKYNAVVREFDLSDGDLSNPVAYYYIPYKVQGFCIGKENDIVLSTSYGLASSHYYIYKQAELVTLPDDKKIDGVDTYVCHNPALDLLAPAMSEDIDYDEDKEVIYTYTESASNKYFFGKLFFATDINTLNLWK